MSSDDRYCEQIQADPVGDTWDEAMRAHAGTCPQCIAFLECVEQMNPRLKALSSANQPMPADLREKMLQQLAECSSASREIPAVPQKTARIFPFAQRVLIPLTMAASLVLGVFLEKTYNFGAPIATEIDRTIGMYIEDVTHDHYLLNRIGRPLEVAITDPAELSSWLTNSLSFAFQLPATNSGLSLQGGRVWHTVGRLSAMAAYETESGNRVILFAVPSANLDLTGAPSSFIGETQVFEGRAWGNDARVWIEGDLALALTAPEGEFPAEWAGVFLP